MSVANNNEVYDLMSKYKFINRNTAQESLADLDENISCSSADEARMTKDNKDAF